MLVEEILKTFFFNLIQKFFILNGKRIFTAIAVGRKKKQKNDQE